MTPRLFLVDDDQDDRELFCEALAEVCPEAVCDTAGSAEQLFDLLDRCTVPDLIFLDVNLPTVSGWDCLVMIRERPEYVAVPIIMYSTSSYQRDVTIADEMGALCFITKPTSFKVLKQIHEIILGHLQTGTLSQLSQSLEALAGR